MKTYTTVHVSIATSELLRKMADEDNRSVAATVGLLAKAEADKRAQPAWEKKIAGALDLYNLTGSISPFSLTSRGIAANFQEGFRLLDELFHDGQLDEKRLFDCVDMANPGHVHGRATKSE
jgi:hypothetical protein